MNSRHKNIKFTKEVESNGSLPFLDVLVSREEGKFTTNIYRKPTFSGVFTNFESFLPSSYKNGLVFTLLYRCFRICSSVKKFHEQVEFTKNTLRMNSYPDGVLKSCIQTFMRKLVRPKVAVHTVAKKEVLLVLPYLGHVSVCLREKLHVLFSSSFPYCKLRLVFRSNLRLRSLFSFKDKLPTHLRSCLVYRYRCSSCNAAYIGKTKRQFKVRMCEHLGISHLTGKERSIKESQMTAIHKHNLECMSAPSFCDFEILASETNDFRLTLKESLLIKHHNPCLNKTVQSKPLELF